MDIINVKVGDKVLVTSRFNKSIKTVKKITPKGAIRLDNDVLYDCYGKKKSSDIWNISSICKLTPENKKEFMEDMFVNETYAMLKNIDKKNLDYKKCEAIRKILNIE